VIGLILWKKSDFDPLGGRKNQEKEKELDERKN